MYPRLWVPQLRAHILSNFAWNTVLLIVLPVVYVLLPQIVATGHGYLRGSGYVPSEFEQRLFEDHWKIIGFSALFAFGASEVQGYLLRRRRAAPFINAPFQAVIAELAQRAGLRFTPAITALLKIGHGQTGRSPFKLLRRTGFEIFMPHPAIVDRAEVLEVPVPRLPEPAEPAGAVA